MSKSGNKGLYRELKNWRQNKTENWKLAETQDLFDKQLASRRKSHAKEVEQLSKELGVKVTKATPSVDEHLGKSQRRNENVRAVERARLDRKYKTICNANMKNFKQLKLSDRSAMPPEMVERIVAKRRPNSAGKKTALTPKPASITDAVDGVDKKKTGGKDKDKDKKKDNDKDTDTNKNRDKRGSDADDGEENSEDESGDVEEPPEWYMGRRRFTLAALNEVPDHIVEARRKSVGALDLAAILEVANVRRSRLDDEKKAVGESLDSEKEDAEEESAADDSDTEKVAKGNSSDTEKDYNY